MSIAQHLTHILAQPPKPGDLIEFPNGGIIDVHLVRDGVVYYAAFSPADGRTRMERREVGNFLASVAITMTSGADA